MRKGLLALMQVQPRHKPPHLRLHFRLSRLRWHKGMQQLLLEPHLRRSEQQPLPLHLREP